MDRKLFLIDGHALIFKMYYAFFRHPMINSKGEDTSILFGFTKYLLELTARENPTHLAVAFDPPGGTYRHEMFPEYKANRAETPQLVIDALEPLTELCGAMNIPVLMSKGFEADDVIGTVAKKAEKEGFAVYMVTPDKDYGQLVSERIFQYRPGQGGENTILGRAEICEKYGISTPEQVIEILTLCGDTADNVPGIKGVGEVGAGKLIGKYGTVENIYAHLDELPPKQKAAFEAAEGYIGMSHELVTIKTDVPIEADTAEMTLDSGFSPLAAELFRKYEFGSLLKYIPQAAAEEAEPGHGETALTIKEVSPAKILSIATETGNCSVIAECTGDGIFATVSSVTAGVVSSRGNFASTGTADDFRTLLTDGKIAKTGHDIKKMCDVLANSGIVLGGKLYDIELMHYIINPEKSHEIGLLARQYLNISLEIKEEKAVSLSLFDVQENDEKPSRTREAVITAMLGKRLSEELEKLSLTKLYEEMEEPLIRVLSGMECAGVKVDLRQLHEYAAELGTELEQIQERVREMAGEPELNILSTRQIGRVIFEKLALDPKARAKKGARYMYSTDEETLAALSDRHPIINEILEYRGVRKLLSTYIDPLPAYVSPRTGKIHTTFNQALTSTGRLSSSKPNLQNIPVRTDRGKEIRKAFVPGTPDGFIVSADYSQIELRIMAHLSGDGHMIDAFRKNLDVHSMTAARIFGVPPEEVTAEQRRMAKTANFGIIYGISAFGLAQRLQIPRNEAKKLIEDYFENFPSISSYMEKTIAGVRETGYAETLFGRRRYLPDINSRNPSLRALAERNAINAPVQGTAADIIKKAMLGVDARIAAAGLKSRMVLQVHDELVFDVVPSEREEMMAIAVAEMENVIELSVPLTVECNYGKNWLEAH